MLKQSSLFTGCLVKSQTVEREWNVRERVGLSRFNISHESRLWQDAAAVRAARSGQRPVSKIAAFRPPTSAAVIAPGVTHFSGGALWQPDARRDFSGHGRCAPGRAVSAVRAKVGTGRDRLLSFAVPKLNPRCPSSQLHKRQQQL